MAEWGRPVFILLGLLMVALLVSQLMEQDVGQIVRDRAIHASEPRRVD